MKTNYCYAWFKVPSPKALAHLGLISLTLLLASCSAEKSEKIVVRGSNTFGEELCPRLIDEYKKNHPGADFDTEFKGTSYGLGALIAGNCDIAAASREINANEMALTKDTSIAFNDHVVGAYSVAVVVNAANGVSDMSLNQVRDIFSGTIQNWKEVGGPDAPIHLYIRSPISGTYLGFQEVAMDRKPYATGVKALTNHVEIVNAVAKDPNGIGYCSIDLTKSQGVKGVSIAGVPPTIDTVNKGKYPYARVLRLYTNKSKESTPTVDFIKFIQSPSGQKIVNDMGYVPRT